MASFPSDGAEVVATTTQATTGQRELLNKRLSRLTSNERAALAAVVNRLRQRYGDDLLRMVLFGSKARGDSDAESDLDLLIVVRIPDDDYWKRWNEIVDGTYDLELDYSVVFSFLIKDEPDYRRMRRWNLLINRNIERDGIELWTSPPNKPSFE